MLKGAKRFLQKLTKRAPSATPATSLPPTWHQGVWCPIVGGLANQLICYRVGRMLADTHGIPLLADISHYCFPESRPYLLCHFSPSFDILFTAESQTTAWSNQAADLLATVTTRNAPHFWLSDTQKQIRTLFLRKPDKPIIADLWTGLAFKSVARDYFRKPHNTAKIQFRIDTLSPSEASFLKRINQSASSIAVHVRRTDFANHDGGLLAPATQYNDAIRHIESIVGRCEVFVFSDDPSWCEENLRASGQLFYSPVSGEKNGHVDMYLASQCRHKVLTNESTFSQLIDAISQFADNERIIARCSRRNHSPIFEEYLHA